MFVSLYGEAGRKKRQERLLMTSLLLLLGQGAISWFEEEQNDSECLIQGILILRNVWFKKALNVRGSMP